MLIETFDHRIEFFHCVDRKIPKEDTAVFYEVGFYFLFVSVDVFGKIEVAGGIDHKRKADIGDAAGTDIDIGSVYSRHLIRCLLESVSK